MEYTFKVMAVTAPHWVKLPANITQSSLNSTEPFSLQNAIRLAVHHSKNNKSGWSKSNWHSPDLLKESVMFYQYFENQKEDYINRLRKIKPDLLIITCMTLGYRGAIEIATIAKKVINKDIIVVIGGKHIIETTYLSNGNLGSNKSCPLYQIKNGIIPRIFDLVVNGDGEEVIYYIGELISKQDGKNNTNNFFANINFLKKAKGDWIIGYIDKESTIKYLKSEHKELNQDEMPFPIELFSPTSNFPVFEVDRTIHSYSYLSKGCPFDCFFCSEKKSINGKLKQTDNGSQRLYRQFKIIYDFGKRNNINVSSFVEDSVLLGGKINLLKQLRTFLLKSKFTIPFGGQYTVDLLLNKQHQKVIKDLSNLGLSYFFVGIETNEQALANMMSKNTNKNITWINKIEQVLDFLCSINIKCGFSILFGLGEKHASRLALLNQIIEWQKRYGTPNVISLNLATNHPLTRSNFDYIDWGTNADSKYLHIFTEIFGEASEKYCFDKSYIGTVPELTEIKKLYNSINKRQ